MRLSKGILKLREKRKASSTKLFRLNDLITKRLEEDSKPRLSTHFIRNQNGLKSQDYRINSFSKRETSFPRREVIASCFELISSGTLFRVLLLFFLFGSYVNSRRSDECEQGWRRRRGQTMNSLTEKGTDDDVWQDKRFGLIKKETETEKD